MPSQPFDESGLVGQEWENQKRLELARSRLRENSSNLEDSNPVPSSFTEFAQTWLGVELMPAQRVLCLVAFDGVEPQDLVGRERELARELFGQLDAIPETARDVIAVIIGARSGKTYLFALRLLHLALVVDLSTLAPGEEAVGLIIAPDIELAEQALNFIRGAIGTNETLLSMVVSDTTEWIDLKRPDGEIASIRVRAAAKGGKTGRGKSLFCALLDEACFFRDSNYAVNDDEVFKAVQPRIIPGGQLLMPSTPWTESGLLYTMWKKCFGAENANYLAAHAPTLLMTLRADGTYFRQTDVIVAKERERDPENARREFDAEPMGGGAVHFFDPIALAACIDEDMPAIVPRKTPFERAWMGLDTAFRKNPTGGVVARATGPRGSMVIVAECVEITPPKGGMLKPSTTIQSLVVRAKFHHAEALVADQHYIETVRENAGGLTLIEAPSVPADAYTVVRDGIAEGRVKISAQHGRLIAQLRDVMSKPTAGGNISISSPTRGTSHGDVASAFVLAMWKALDPGAGALKGEAARSQTSRNLDEYSELDRRRGDERGGRVRRVRSPLE